MGPIRNPRWEQKRTEDYVIVSRLHTDNVNPLLKEALILSKSFDSQGTYSWFTFVKNITSDSGFRQYTKKKKKRKKKRE
jgi:hypothetical protein